MGFKIAKLFSGFMTVFPLLSLVTQLPACSEVTSSIFFNSSVEKLHCTPWFGLHTQLQCGKSVLKKPEEAIQETSPDRNFCQVQLVEAISQGHKRP